MVQGNDIRKAKAVIIRTKTQLERVRKPKIKTDDRDIRIEYSDEKDFRRIIKQIISYKVREKNRQMKMRPNQIHRVLTPRTKRAR